MKLYVSDIEESYKDTIIGHLGNSGTSDLLLQMVQCWRECKVDVENQYLSMVLYCSHMMYSYYYRILFTPIKLNEGVKYIHNEIFNNIPHFIKNHLHGDCIQYGFVM